MDIRNKIVVITGASKGIGAATARAFVKEGARVVLAARSDDLLKKLASELGTDHASAKRTDVTNREDVTALMQHALDHFGRIDILANNAGAGMAGNIATLSLESLRKVSMRSVGLIGALAPGLLERVIMRRRRGKP